MSGSGFRDEIAFEGFVQLRRDDAAVDTDPRVGEATGLSIPERDRALRHKPWGERAVWLTDPNGIAVRLVEWMRPAAAGGDRGRPVT